MANIARAFPGLFSYRDLLNLDIREVFEWYRLSVKSLMTSVLVSCNTSNMLMIGDDTRQTLLDATLKKVVLSDDEGEAQTVAAPPLDEEYQTREEYQKRFSLAKAMIGGMK